MYKVSANLSSTYGSEVDSRRATRTGPEMPHVTTGGHRMTNVQLSNGDVVQGIRKNNAAVLGSNPGVSSVPSDLAPGPSLRPLRYTPGLACDAHLESLRPEREPKHAPFQGTDTWRKKLIPTPNTYEGSFVDADMQQFRPNPRTPMADDPWYTSRVPDPAYFPANERLAGTQFLPTQPPEMLNPYEQVYPQDELSRIKMRNRRFLNSCGQEMANPSAMGGGYYGATPPMMMMVPPPQAQAAAPMYHPMMMMPQQQVPAGPVPAAAVQQASSEMDDLAILDQELNMTRRATRPFVPTHATDYSALEKQRVAMEEPSEVIVPRLKVNPLADMPSSIDQLPAPKPRSAASKSEPGVGEMPKPRAEVNIADQIAIRSLVLGKSLSKVGKDKA